MMITKRNSDEVARVENFDISMAWRMGRAMLRYRPIAPKPSLPSTGSLTSSHVVSSNNHSKRKRGNGGGKRGKKTKVVDVDSSTSSESTTSTIVTLPLLPETPEKRENSPKPPPQPVAWVATTGDRAVGPVKSWVTVEGVTDTWLDGEFGGRAVSDEAAVRALGLDEEPAFVSDEWGRVCWTNGAYRRMAARGEGEEVSVGLVARVPLPARSAWRAFTCMVHVRHERRRGKEAAAAMAAPCDVWRLDAGGWAWRLDLKAALSLRL